ncbi:O-antigen/teichoic acid export membrane protein [Pararhizobium capsulatum DSM 1112]|uniref:O-antigen/teichoic acid export membrane protein n=1 Tax=Pararhizobium capsulatum DSM 1112 TaxID=1121113 RepID=A0ABU0BZZ7_9HYPH|nr:hypothetical protein [Pararhizobium capsulatum]MDQ0322417.1 O-antigen/teichoic acid export membrane protein [Pararhizobium capsulatum DSM 1112]
MATLKNKYLNILLLISSYGLGQGSIFAAQTWLVARQELNLLAAFGTHFSVAMLGIIFVDAGSLTVFARQSSLLAEHDTNPTPFWKLFWEVTTIRVTLSLFCTLAISVYLFLLSDDKFTTNFFLYALPAYLVWGFNFSGLFDGLRRSGLSGATGAMPYIFSATALILSVGRANEDAGAMLGLAFTSGHIAALALQVVSLKSVGMRITFVLPGWEGIWQAARDGLSLIGSTIPGQLYYRFQLLISVTLLGSESTALFVYGKQILAATMQIVGFLRRVEFPSIVSSMTLESRNKPTLILRHQWISIITTFIFSMVMLTVGLGLTLENDKNFSRIGSVLVAFSAVVLTGSLALTFKQGMAALGQFRPLMLLSVAGVIGGAFLSVTLARPLGIYGFVLADLLEGIICITVSVYILRRK